MNRIPYIAALLLFLTTSAITGQVPDSLQQPSATFSTQTDTLVTAKTTPGTLKVKKRGLIGRLFKEDYPNPKKALLLSLAIPGAGQLYNKRWWKLPLVYGAYTGLVLAIDYNTSNYKRFRDAYIAELANEPHEFSDTRFDAGDLRRIRDGFDKNKQLSYFGLFAVHLVQTAEAFVDCHLKTFDVSEDLTLKITPAMDALSNGQTYVGIGVRLEVKSKK